MIRQAKREDVHEVAPLVLDALHDIAFMLTGETTEKEVLATLEQYFIEGTNRLSYNNTYVKEIDGQVAGIIILYYGNDAKSLDEPILTHVRQKTGKQIAAFDVEADLDEYYIDTVSVSKNYRGKGIGTELITAAEEIGKQRGHKKISLNVDKENIRAYELYSRLNYESTKDISINNHPFFHMVKAI